MENITGRVRSFEKLNPKAFAYILHLDVDGEEVEVYATASTACRDVIETCRVYDFDIETCGDKTVALKVALNRRQNPGLPPLRPGMGFPSPENLELIMDDIDRQIFLIEAEERFKKNVLLVGDTISGKIGAVEGEGSEYSFDIDLGNAVEKCYVISGIASTAAVNTLCANSGRVTRLYGVHTPHGFFVHKICK